MGIGVWFGTLSLNLCGQIICRKESLPGDSNEDVPTNGFYLIPQGFGLNLNKLNGGGWSILVVNIGKVEDMGPLLKVCRFYRTMRTRLVWAHWLLV